MKGTIVGALYEIAGKVGGEGAALPTVSAGDSGKVLTVNAEGKWVAANIPSQLPAVSSANNGQVLTVSEGVWAAAALPEG